MKRPCMYFLIAVLVLSFMPSAALAAALANNPAGTTLDSVGAGDTMEYNYGTITENRGTIEENNGTVTDNYFGTIKENNGTVTTNHDGTSIIFTNNGTVQTNKGAVMTNAAGAQIVLNSHHVADNYGTVTNDTAPNILANVENNYGTVTNGFVKYNFNTAANATVENNLGGTLTGSSTAANRYYKLNITGEATFYSEDDSIITDHSGQMWIKEGSRTIILSVNGGYELADAAEPVTFTFSAAEAVSTADKVYYSLVSVSGDITVNVKTQPIAAYDFIKGADAEWSGSGDLSFTVNTDLGNVFSAAYIGSYADNGTDLLDKDMYTVKQGAEYTTDIILKESFLSTLGAGKYALILIYGDDVMIFADFSVAAGSGTGESVPELDDVPKMGEDLSSEILPAVIAAAIAGTVLPAAVFRRKRMD